MAGEVTTHDKLSKLRKDAVDSLQFAIRYVTAPEPSTLSIDPDTRRDGLELHRSERDLAVMGAVQDLSQYILACQLCIRCEHRMIEHTEEPTTSCGCCARVGRVMKEDQA